ncbi:MAG TPA: adenylate/guanylate cyclase domain-containing protein [Aggregatilineales bacterium]|nr:adenylate/guanylate cyclase domain-containing protein [Aggregatilineales bacterium]
MNSELPSGVVTFLFTDIERSTQLWEHYPEAMKSALARHDEILRKAIEAHHGVYVKTTGDGCHAVFAKAEDGIWAACDAQRALCAESWPEIAPDAVRVRMGLHTGDAELRAGDYFGPTLNRIARLLSTGYGGQILLSRATAELAAGKLGEGLALLDLGEHRLKDLVRSERVYQLAIPGLPGTFPPIKSLDAFPNNLPIQLTSFIGRERELAEANRLLSTTHLLTLIGPGGTGKTRLSLQIAAEQLHSFADGAWLLELAPLSDPSQIVPTLAALFSLREVQGVPLIGLLMAYLRDKHLLLILDNCEHLVEACAGLADDLLRACPNLKIIASSREALGIAGESVYRVPSLTLPDETQVKKAGPAELLNCESAQLFVERARAVQSAFTVGARNAHAIAQICQRLDGIPLALELAAARVAVFSPEQIATRLGDRFMLLTGGSRTALPRQQTLRALIDWSYDLLSEPEQGLLRRLSVFAGGWTFEAAEAVCSDLDVFSWLPQLVNKSLVTVDDSGPETRYRLLETIRQYARDRLFEANEAAAARDQHLHYFLTFTAQADEGIRGPDNFTWLDRPGIEVDLAWLDRVEIEADNVRAALEWGLEQHPEETLDLANHMGRYWTVRGDGGLNPQTGWLQGLVARVGALPPVEGEAARKRIRARSFGLSNAAFILIRLGDSTTGQVLADEAIALARQADEPEVLGAALTMYILSSRFLGDIAGARRAIEEASMVAHQLRDKTYIAMSLVARAWIESGGGDSVRLQALLDEARSMANEIRGTGTYSFLFSFSQLARITGNLDEARTYIQKATAFLPQFKSKQNDAMIYSELAHLERQAGNWQAARDGYRDTILRWKDLGHRAAVANQLECFAFVARAQDQPERAARLLGAAETLRAEIGAPMTDYERAEYDVEVTALHSTLDKPTFEAAWAAGSAMTPDDAVGYAIQ